MSNDLFVALAAPFHPERVSWRVGSTTGDKKKGMALAYIDARDVMDRLDSVVGPANWRRVHPHANGRTLCSLEIKIGGEWVAKEDGAGDTDVEAEKGALSDAFKRAAVNWGIGRYLYDLPSPWVEIEQAGKSYRIAEKEHEKLEAILKRDAREFVPAAASAPKSQEKAPPADPPPNVDALLHSVSLMETLDELKAWAADNKAGIDALDDITKARVRGAYGERQKALAGGAAA
ncbi:Rad52/Rad22 family DNA repair protein [Xanthobacter sp. V3C-3]|uniref:Rad52/Rad22 family DNA repair protein n=1 Tax=Xanthobacter lutulentifluminis TaxID=3119935 RepID=UPI003727CED6